MAFTGQIIQLPVGQDGINGIENLDRIRPDQLVDAVNVSYAQGGITKDGGAAKLNAVALGAPSTVIGLYDWWPTSSSQRTIAFTSNGSAFRDTGAGTFATTLRSGQSWTTASIPVFVEGGKEAAASNKKLFIFLGALNQVQVLSGDGVVITNLTTPPVDWAANFPTCGVLQGPRLLGAGNSNDPHRVYYSTSTDMEDFTAAGSGTVAVFPGEGQYIAAMANFLGHIIIWKYPRGIYLLDARDGTPSNWTVDKLTGNVGGVSPRCWTYIDSDIIFMDASGTFHRLSTVQEFGDFKASAISERVYFTEWARRNLNLAKLTNTQAVYYPYRREAHFTAASTNSSLMDRRIIWDFNNTDSNGVAIPRFRYNTFPNGPALYAHIDASSIVRPGGGDNAGFVWKLDQDTKSYDGAGYTSLFKTAALDGDFGDSQNPGGTRRKIGKFLELVIVPKGTFTLSVGIYWDDEIRDTISYSMQGTGVALGTFVIGTDSLAGGTIRREKHRLVGDGFRFALEASNSNAGEDFSISKFYLYYALGSNRVDVD